MKLTLSVKQLILIAQIWLLSVAVVADIKDIRLWQSPEQTRLVFDLTEPLEHRIFTLSNPHRVVIDLTNTLSKKSVSDIDLSNTNIRDIRAAVRNKKDLRIVLDINQPLIPKSFPLKPNKKYPYHRLVVDLNIPEQASGKPLIKTDRTSLQTMRNIIIAIDAGHGGEDPGAIGHGRIYEKHVVLAIAKELQRLLKAEKGFTPFMVRTGDYYIGLRERTARARKANADFFVSIHADAFKHPGAHGSSVFVLSERGATSEAARWLADKENESDLIGGVSLEDKEDHLAMTLLDLSMTAKRSSSLRLGGNILNHMGNISRLHKRKVEEAAFVVLKAPDMPALLVETGFISNPGEARKLNKKSYQKKMARALFKGIKSYFVEHPPRGTLLAAKRDKKIPYTTYTIRRGDTLSGIAQRQKVSLSGIRRLNRLESDQLMVGQTLKIPKS